MINRDKLSNALEHLATLFDDTIYEYYVSNAVEVEPGVAQVVLNISVKTDATVKDYISRELNVKVKEFDAQIDTMLRSEEHTSELQSRFDLVCRLLLEKKKKNIR